MRVHHGSLVNLLNACADAYSERTIQGYSSDLRLFIDWCAEREEAWLPADPQTIAAFVDDQVEHYSIATIKRRLCAIAFAHRLRDLPTPITANIVQIAVRRGTRKRANRRHQKLGLTYEMRSKIVAACPPTISGIRDAALISVGYDTLCRSSELAAIDIEHIQAGRNGAISILVPRSKADVAGDGRIAHLSPNTFHLLSNWIEAANLREGPLFRSLHLHRVADGPLATSSIRRIIKRATQRAGIDPAMTAELSGHSMRIGAAQDMLVAGFDALAIMQAGGWKSTNVVLRYVENAATQDLHKKRWAALDKRESNKIKPTLL